MNSFDKSVIGLTVVIICTIALGGYFYSEHLLDTSYTITGKIIGKTVESSSGLFSSSSYEVCIIEHNNKRFTVGYDGCLYKEGEMVDVFVSDVGYSIIGISNKTSTEPNMEKK